MNSTTVETSTSMIAPGFSLTNRLLLYASVLLAPAQYQSGINNNCPSNLGFLAYNIYNQVQWFRYVKAKQLHALCLAVPHFNLIYTFSYFAGITSGNVVMGGLLGLGSAGALVLNLATSWISWKTNQPEGLYDYRFFFFGWRTLKPGWHKFFLCWEIFDSISSVSFVILILATGIALPLSEKDESESSWANWVKTMIAIPVGAAAALLAMWPLVLWTELVVSSNHIESPTDWISVYLFIAQAGAMVIPPCTAWLGCFRST